MEEINGYSAVGWAARGRRDSVFYNNYRAAGTGKLSRTVFKRDAHDVQYIIIIVIFNMYFYSCGHD